jgi:phospho-N-acetylmuramoyl-pentapeptide-transferase
MALNFPDASGRRRHPVRLLLPRHPHAVVLRAGRGVGWIVYLIWISFISVAWSNSTNLTDGLDGLATGRHLHRLRATAS